MSETTQATLEETAAKTYGARAYAALSASSGLAPATIRRRAPRPQDVQLDVLYCGVCHSDLHQVRNEWHEERATFQQLMQEARRELARHYLLHSSLELNDTAYLLGYEDAHSFFRAFHDWEGIPPGEWRSRHARATTSLQ
jgi:methylphosphotriester-DNA--protein-cysteine methyltransferase